MPFDPKALRSEGFAGIVRRIREEEPPKPLKSVHTFGWLSREIALPRGRSVP